MARADAHGGAEAFHLLLRHQPGVIILMPGEGQAHALDGIGDEAGGLIARSILGAEGFGLACGEGAPEHAADVAGLQQGEIERHLGDSRREADHEEGNNSETD